VECVRNERRDDVAWLILDRPSARNALSSQVIRELRGALCDVKADPGVRAVVLTGSGERFFSAGGDISELDTSGDPLAAVHERSELNQIFRDLHELGKPTIARVCGLALAGGFGLALGCDFIIASEDAQFGLPEVRLGLWPYIVTESLVRATSPRLALQLMLTGRRLDAAEGHRVGFVYQVVPLGEIDSAVGELMTQLRAASPQAVALGRTTFYQALDAPPGARLALNEHAFTVNLGMPDAHEGMSAFLDRRSPRWDRAEGD
jgi:enoyl-CoA hydratase